MANPQPDKYTMVANELMEQVPNFKLNGTQLRIILIIWRYTYGFGRKDHIFSLTFLSKALGAHKNVISREVQFLIEKRVLKLVSAETHTDSRKLRFNKDYDTWLIKRGSTKKLIPPVNQLVDTQSTNQLTPPVNQLVDQERKRSFKENIKESNGEVMKDIPYQTIIDYLNKKAVKKYTIKSKPTIKLINGRFEEGRTLEDFMYVIDVKVSHWLNDPKWDAYLRPSTLFNATNFENYLNQTVKHKINSNGTPSKTDLSNDVLRNAFSKEVAYEENGVNSTNVADNKLLPEFSSD
jgi:phage replication O-like protein O